jgi:hypothetical protein
LPLSLAVAPVTGAENKNAGQSPAKVSCETFADNWPAL